MKMRIEHFSISLIYSKKNVFTSLSNLVTTPPKTKTALLPIQVVILTSVKDELDHQYNKYKYQILVGISSRITRSYSAFQPFPLPYMPSYG